MHLNTAGSEARAEMNIAIGVNPHTGTIGCRERCFVDTELNGPKIGGAEFGFVL